MLDITLHEIDKLIRDMKAAGDIPEAVRKEMVDAKAKVIEEGVVYNAATMLVGPYYEGEVARSVTRKKPRATKNGASVIIYFKGMQHGNRLGEIAFINEYGKKKQPARPFIKHAFRKSGERAAAAARKVLSEHLDKHNL